MSDLISLNPIGIIRSEHRDRERTPVQPAFADKCKGTVHVYPEFAEGLQDIEGFSHIYLLFHFHRSGPADMLVRPYLQNVKRGLFATRAPRRPNPLGLSIVRLLRREGNVLSVSNIDILDGTPLLDIKPYIARFDAIEKARCGWIDDVDDETAEKLGKRL